VCSDSNRLGSEVICVQGVNKCALIVIDCVQGVNKCALIVIDCVQGVIVVVPKEVVCADEEYLISIGLRVL
jgi:hypothetical protein